ncbi:UNVERIFIED_CONTAM: hypothetical protein GTU68_059870 [Idotea baltica]|nr:hypothetical protein [Idotea baltica]
MAKNKSFNCVAQVRESNIKNTLADEVVVPVINGITDWSHALQGVDCVIHCAARVHQMKESKEEALVAYNEVNTLGTLNLAKQAAALGVKRFIFLSSIKVNGEFSEVGFPFSEYVSNSPCDPYGKSKYDAELALKALADETGLEVVIIRPPLVYGVGVKANFQTMMSWVNKGFPLPLGAIKNKRSLVYVDNLVDLILTTVVNENAAGRTFLVSDDCDISTTQLLMSISGAMDKLSRLLPIPMSWIKFVATVVGKPQIAQRLCGSLQVDISETKKILGWEPPVSFEDAIQKTVNGFVGKGK